MAGLTSLPHDSILDLDPWVGQRKCTFRFQLTDGVTGEQLGDITPLRNASLTHDTGRTIKRQLTLSLGADDTASINAVRDRVSVFMVLSDGIEYPLGKYMFTDFGRQVFTSGKLGTVALNDEMFLVDQQILNGISGTLATTVGAMISAVLAGLPIEFVSEQSPFQTTQAWGVGTGRGSILEALALSGDYFSPWFDNAGIMQFIRSFDPIARVPELDYDAGNQVTRANIVENDDLLTAPNRFVVISNTGGATGSPSSPAVGVADVPASAPHSAFNRGFVIQDTQDLQLNSPAQAEAVARNLVNRQTVFETVTLVTPPDPRHDSYNVIRWQNELWLELAWSMSLTEGGAMNHRLRKAYSP